MSPQVGMSPHAPVSSHGPDGPLTPRMSPHAPDVPSSPARCPPHSQRSPPQLPSLQGSSCRLALCADSGRPGGPPESGRTSETGRVTPGLSGGSESLPSRRPHSRARGDPDAWGLPLPAEGASPGQRGAALGGREPSSASRGAGTQTPLDALARREPGRVPAASREGRAARPGRRGRVGPPPRPPLPLAGTPLSPHRDLGEERERRALRPTRPPVCP